MSRKKRQKFVPEGSHIQITPQNAKQKELLQAIQSHPMVFTTGCAGTGKTYIPTMLAARALKRNEIDRIIITRPNIPSGPSLGADKGYEEEKMAYWLREILNILADALGRNDLGSRLRTGTIETVPMEKMRGRSFRDAFIIMDEAQNTDRDQMKMFVTRIGQNARVVINGDTGQSDIGSDSGLAAAVHIAQKYGMDVPVIHFCYDDVVRSDLCRQWIINWDRFEDRGQRSDVRRQPE